MDIHFYSEDDLRSEKEVEIDGESYPFSFVADVPGDNPDVLGEYDNHALADRLTRFKAMGDKDRLDCESCCFYAHFRHKEDGVAFIKKLNAYLTQKSKLLRDASSF